jgi:hypothetical protein
MEGDCSTGQSPQWAVVPMEEEEEEEEEGEEAPVDSFSYQRSKTTCSEYSNVMRRHIYKTCTPFKHF